MEGEYKGSVFSLGCFGEIDLQDVIGESHKEVIIHERNLSDAAIRLIELHIKVFLVLLIHHFLEMLLVHAAQDYLLVTLCPLKKRRIEAEDFRVVEVSK